MQSAPIIAQLIAFRALLALLLGVGAVAFGLVALLRRRWGIAAGLAIVLAAASVTNVVVLAGRGGLGAAPAGELTVLAWNTQGGAVTPDVIARLVVDSDADIVSLPETDELAAAEVARLVALEGRQMFVDTTYGDSSIPTSVLIADRLGPYGLDAAAGSTTGLPSGVWRSLGTGPTVVAAHPMPPLLESMDEWRTGLRWVADQCDAPDVIVAGDLNATVDHFYGLGVDGALIGECRDAALEGNAAETGSWPKTAPAWLASPIDHVLVGSAWIVRSADVLTSLEDAGTDHRPIVATLDRR